MEKPATHTAKPVAEGQADARCAHQSHPLAGQSPAPSPFAAQKKALTALEARDRLRHLSRAAGADFTSNDYLGLARSADLSKAAADALARGVAVGSGGSRLLRGNDPEHESLEAEAAAFFGAATATCFSGGFAANQALFATLPRRGDLIVHDELIHASAHEGMASGKADHQAAQHNDPGHVEDLITGWRASGGTGTPWIAVESLYSMDGDFAPLDDLAVIADRHDAILVIDEAHATGVFGPDGRGLAAHLEGRESIITLHTFGKALGVHGGAICGSEAVRQFLVNRARGFIYATAPSPLISATVRAALLVSRFAGSRRAALTSHIALIGELLTGTIGFDPSPSQIKPVIVGRDADAADVAAELQFEGFDVRAIRPPTVPEGTARLRIATTLNVTEADIRNLVEALGQALSRRGLEARQPGIPRST